MSEVRHDTVTAQETEAGAGSRQCQAFQAPQVVPPEEFRRYQEFSERCPSQAEALVWCSCQNDCQYPEEVCAGHVDPPGENLCGYCAQEGLFSLVTVTVIGRI